MGRSGTQQRSGFSGVATFQNQNTGANQIQDSQRSQLNPVRNEVEEPESKPKQVFLDEQGRLIDENGNVLNVKQATELKINQKSQKDNKVRDLLNMKKYGQATSSDILSKRKFFDSSLDVQYNKRDKKKNGAFNFVEEGVFIKRAEQLRKKQLLEEYELKKASEGGKGEESKDGDQMDISIDQIQSAANNERNDGKIHLRKTVNLKPLDPIPDFEWWDSAILNPTEDQSIIQRRLTGEIVEDTDIFIDKITHYIQHPVPLRNEYVENINKMTIPVHLTDKEKKRLKKLKRAEKEKDKQEKVKLGLMPAPLPKIKLSNYMKVLGKEAIADPSRVEQQVKRLVDARLEQHLKKNEDNKLTRDQKEAKMKRKHERDITDQLNPLLKFKVDMNAQQFHLGGFCFIADYNMAPADLPNLVLIEGGPRAIKKYKRLMLRRIKWNEKSKKKQTQNQNDEDPDTQMQIDQQNQIDENEDIDEVKESLDKKCFLVWEGVVKKKSFERWRVVDIRSENEAKRLLGEKGCEHYWSMVANFHPDRAEGEDHQGLEKVLM
eukprot:403339332